MPIADTGQDIAQPRFWIDPIKLGGLDQRIDRGGTLAALVRAGECPVATAKGNAAQAVLGSVVVWLEAPVVAEAGQCRPPGHGVADRLGKFALGRDAAKRLISPAEEGFDGDA